MPQGWDSYGQPEEDWWIRQVQEGIAFRRKHAREPEWRKWRNWYRGEWPRGVLPTNVYFKMLRTLVPRVYYRNPSVSITPTLPGIEAMLLAKLLERSDNKLLDLMGVKGQMKRAVQLAIMFGTSVPMLGFGAQFTPTPEPLDTRAPEGRSKRYRNRVEYNSLVHPNAPWFLTAHPGDVVFPDKCATWEEARWICLTTRRSSHDLANDGRLKNNKDLPEGGKGSNLIYDGGPGRMVADGVRVWIIRDKKTGKVFCMAPDGGGGKKILACEDDALQIDGGLPAYPLVFNVDDEAIWGVPDSQIIGPQQTEINEIRSLIMRHRRAALVKMLYEEGMIEPDEIDKMTDDDVRAAIKVKNINGVRDLPAPQIPEALLTSEELVAQDVQEILGLGTNQFGEYAPGSADRSATEANIVNQATQIRVDERRDTCADLITAFVSDMNVVLMENWSEEQVEQVVGPAGVPIWIKFRPDMLREGHYVVKVDPDTALPQTKAIREQKAVQGYGLLSQNAFINKQALTEWLLNEMWGVDADSLMLNPIMHTSPDNQMSVPQAVQHLSGIPVGKGNGTQPPEANLLQ
jgi:hypothetical protein